MARKKQVAEGKRRSFWIDRDNVIRLEHIKETLKLDNENRVINQIIRDYGMFIRNKKLIEALDERLGK